MDTGRRLLLLLRTSQGHAAAAAGSRHATSTSAATAVWRLAPLKLIETLLRCLLHWQNAAPSLLVAMLL
jgi:hypothetical protein